MTFSKATCWDVLGLLSVMTASLTDGDQLTKINIDTAHSETAIIKIKIICMQKII